jgi:hypothetical protein
MNSVLHFPRAEQYPSRMASVSGFASNRTSGTQDSLAEKTPTSGCGRWPGCENPTGEREGEPRREGGSMSGGFAVGGLCGTQNALISGFRQRVAKLLVVQNHARRNTARHPVMDLLHTEPEVIGNFRCPSERLNGFKVITHAV